MSNSPHEQVFPLVDHCKSNMGMDIALARQLELQSLGLHHELEQQDFTGFKFNTTGFIGVDGLPQMQGYLQNNYPPPSAFLGEKCALWDCPRPALGLGWSQEPHEYCSVYHAGLAPGEGYPGRAPVVRPGGIGLKDNLLFAALGAKAQGKDVGIPECEGAATTKSPWNAPGKSVVASFYCVCSHHDMIKGIISPLVQFFKTLLHDHVSCHF